ncbi:unnamed protein product [Amoebophrya sp. A120]|nr:unnamed protein product [Amoebophrya sp. A120]|eukprot:GSA120T00002241001.1
MIPSPNAAASTGTTSRNGGTSTPQSQNTPNYNGTPGTGTIPSTTPPPTVLAGSKDTQSSSKAGEHDQEIKISKGEKLRPVSLRLITRQLIENPEGTVVRISGLGHAIQEAAVIFNLLFDYVKVHKYETRWIKSLGTTYRAKAEFFPQLRIHFSRAAGFRMRIPMALKPEKVAFLAKPTSFTPIYEKEIPDEVHVGSVNAGSDQLFVGGSAINAAFKRALDEAGIETGKYQDLQRKLWKSASEQLDRVVLADAETCKELKVNYLSCRASYADSTTCSCFLHVFEPAARPMGNAKNAAMVYVVGPRGSECGSGEDFLEKLRNCGKNVVVSVNQYNLKHAKKYTEELPRIDRVRVCLVSGGIYKHPDVDKNDIARALMEGLYLNPSAQVEHSPVFEFAYDEDAFKLAYEKALWIPINEQKTVSTKDHDLRLVHQERVEEGQGGEGTSGEVVQDEGSKDGSSSPGGGARESKKPRLITRELREVVVSAGSNATATTPEGTSTVGGGAGQASATSPVSDDNKPEDEADEQKDGDRFVSAGSVNPDEVVAGENTGNAV